MKDTLKLFGMLFVAGALAIAFIFFFRDSMGIKEVPVKIPTIVTSQDCTEWKGFCVGDTVFHEFYDDTLTCVITKIVHRWNTIGDLIGAKGLNGKCVGADESHFYTLDAGGSDG